jgi:hypothetical protein
MAKEELVDKDRRVYRGKLAPPPPVWIRCPNGCLGFGLYWNSIWVDDRNLHCWSCACCHGYWVPKEALVAREGVVHHGGCGLKPVGRGL